MDIIESNGFIGSVHYSDEDQVFYGKIEGVNDLVTFEGTSVKELKEAFKEAVEDYIELCEELEKDPHKSFKGSLNIRIKPELHRKAFQTAKVSNITLNQLISKAIEREVEEQEL